MNAEALTQHRWLARLVGDWAESPDAVDAPPADSKWTEHVRPVGDVWVVSVGKGEMPDGNPGEAILTLGYDPAKERYVGTWIGSMMTDLWIYEGSLDPTGNVLTLECEGPDFEAEGRRASYRDVITFVDEDHRVFSALVRKEDGEWHKFLETHHWRKG